jgi:hypothetical protein
VASVDTCNVSVIAYDPAHYPHMERHVTAEVVRAHLAGIVAGEAVRYALPRIGVLNFAPHRALGGGITRSPALDAHGKCLSSLVLGLEVPDPDGGPERLDRSA